MDLREKEWGTIHWTDVAQDRDKWRAFVKMNLRIYKMLWNFGVAEGQAASQEGPSYMELVN
jgi:hypothetical protein